MTKDPHDRSTPWAVDAPAAPVRPKSDDAVQDSTATAGDRRFHDVGQGADLRNEPYQIDSTLEDADGPAGLELACGRDLDDLLEQVFTGRADEQDNHQSHCELCSTVLSQTGRQWAPLQMAGARLQTPPPGLRAAVMSAVRHLAGRQWALTLPSVPSPLAALHGRATGHLNAAVGVAAGTVRISTAAVAAVAERAAAAVPGVRRAWARAAPEAPRSASIVTPVDAPTRWGGAAGDAAALGAASAAVGSAAADAAGSPVLDAGGRSGGGARAGAQVVVQLLVVAEYGARLVPLAQAARRAVRRELSAVTSVPGIVVDVLIDDVVVPWPFTG